MVIAHIHAKDHGRRSLRSKVGLETDRWKDRGDCITSHANMVGN